MDKSPRVAPLFAALCVAASAFPSAALAQVVAAPAAASAASISAAAAAAPLRAPALNVPLTSPLALGAALALPARGLAASAVLPAPAAAVAAFSAAQAPAAAIAASVAAPNAASADFAAAPADNRFHVPGPAATGIAEEAAAYAAEAPAAEASPASARTVSHRGIVGRVFDAVRGVSSFGAIFDGSAARRSPPLGGALSLREHKPILLPNGSRPDEEPTLPSPEREATVVVQAYDLPGARDVGGVLESSRKILQADPENPEAVVAAVKAMIDADRARYGVPSSDLRLVHAKKFAGKGDQADTIFVVFRQLKDGLLIHGSALSFTLKVIDGKPQVVAQTGQIFPQIDVETRSTMSEDDIRSRISERTGLPPQEVAEKLQFFEEKIIYSRGAWRHVKLYTADGLPFMIAVDLSNGLVFAWDNRAGARSAAQNEKGSGPAGDVSGKAVDHGPILPAAAIANLPLAFLNVTIGGKTYTTDKNGRFSAPDLQIPAEGLTIAATLSGPFVNVVDDEKKTLSVNVTLKPGDGDVQVVFNSDANLADENSLAQVSAFHKVNFAYAFLKDRGLTTERMDKNPITVKTNINDECNAFYTPGSPSLNFFKSSANCVNSAYDTVADHEYGHYWDDMTGGIMNGGLSEGWGDTLSMYGLNNPIVGEHFLKQPRALPEDMIDYLSNAARYVKSLFMEGKDYIRSGENDYKYNEYDEVHAQGQAWGGFTWKLRKAMIEKLGYEAGIAMAEALVLPTMFAKAATIPDAMAQVLVNAMKKDGTLAFEKDIRDIATFHGVTLPHSSGFVESLVDGATGGLRRLALHASELDGAPAGAAQSPRGAAELAADADAAAAPTVRATLRFTAGALLRKRVVNEIRRYLDEAGASYDLHEYKSWTSSDYLLVITGPEDQVRQQSEHVSRWLREIERGR